MTTRAPLALALLGCGPSPGPAPEGPPPTCDPYGPDCAPLAPRPGTRTCLADADPDALPDLWSQTGCGDAEAPGPDLVPYDVAAPLWSDGAEKARWLVLDPGATIGFAADGEWDWPAGSALIKQFSLLDEDGLVPIETRLMLAGDTGWTYATWRWEGDDAVRLDELEVHPVPGGFDWVFPAEADCTRCHVGGDGTLGPRTVQMDTVVDYGGGVRASQLEVLHAAGVLTGFLREDWHAMPDPTDRTAPLEDRARAWLAANCAHCHQPGGWTPPGMTLDLRWEIPLADTRTCDVPVEYWEGAASGRDRIEPGQPEQSELWLRLIGATATGPMPPYGTSVLDAEGIELIRTWIASLERCP